MKKKQIAGIVLILIAVLGLGVSYDVVFKGIDPIESLLKGMIVIGMTGVFAAVIWLAFNLILKEDENN